MIKTFLKACVRYGLAVALGILFSIFFSLPEKIFVPLASIFVMQTYPGLILREGLQKFILISLSVILGSCLALYLPGFFAELTLIVILLLSFVFETLTALTFIVFVLLSFFMTITSPEMLSFRLYAVTLGAFIGIVINLLIFPQKIAVEFSKALVPVLHAYSKYFSSLINLFLYQNKQDVEQTRNAVQKSMLNLPEWVCESGFSLPFRQGHRHFLVKTEQIGEVLFSLNYLAKKTLEPSLLIQVQEPLKNCVLRVEKIFAAVITVLELNKLTEGLDDFADDILQLEKISESNPLLVAIICNLKDMRAMLLKLTEALR